MFTTICRLDYGYFFAHLAPTLSFVRHAVLWALVYLYTLRSRQLRGKIRTNNKSGLYIGLVGNFSYGSFSLVEVFADKIVSWCPLYYHLKFAFLVWLQLPIADTLNEILRGAKQLYNNHLRPFLLRHQANVDQILGFAHGEMVKLISAHQAEIQFARTTILKIMGSVNQTLRDIGDSDQPQGHNAIERQTRTILDVESDHDD